MVAKQKKPKNPNLGGSRPGAGRKPKGDMAGVEHEPRGPLQSRFPVHIDLFLKKGLPNLRSKNEYLALLGAFENGRERFGFRLVQYSVQRDHLHLIVEAKGQEALARGMQGLTIRIAKALNRAWKGRRGGVFSDRYTHRVLRTPREVRDALVDVLLNAKRHGLHLPQGVDYYSSGPWFDGWKQAIDSNQPARDVMARPGTWLLCTGWRRNGLISLEEQPPMDKEKRTWLR